MRYEVCNLHRGLKWSVHPCYSFPYALHRLCSRKKRSRAMNCDDESCAVRYLRGNCRDGQRPHSRFGIANARGLHRHRARRLRSKNRFGSPANQQQPLFSKMDAFLWKSFVGGSDYASTKTDPGVSTVIGETKRADFNWRWGFRAEAGYRLPHDNWDALFNYTWFHDKSDRHVKSPSGGTIAPIIPPYLPYDPGASATLEGLLRFQNLDIELRRPYFLSRSFSVAPFFGLRNSWIDQHYAVNYYSPSRKRRGQIFS